MCMHTPAGKVEWEQRQFKYHAKCLDWLVDEYSRLSSEYKAYVQRQLQGTGCMELIEFGLQQRTQSKAKL